MRLAPTKIASLLFALSAAGPIGVWVILLFAAVPSGQTPLENATAMLAYVFADPRSSRRGASVLRPSGHPAGAVCMPFARHLALRRA